MSLTDAEQTLQPLSTAAPTPSRVSPVLQSDTKASVPVGQKSLRENRQPASSKTTASKANDGPTQ